ncbi:OprO/OprP family phosphate-selective porin [Pseudoxanthomonas sp.]|uniref:OprO/OprP family phosphate-selective porin n=1 Tax=Pseudoxanthomonas sp. TaxID=1871049 RepID=UPI003F820B2B
MPSSSRRAPRATTLLLMFPLLAMLPVAHAEDTVTLKPSGRLHYDFVRFDNDNRGAPERDGDDLRAAWLAIAGRFHVVDYKLEADFAGHRPVARDAYIARGFGDTTVTLGQFKQFYTLDDRGSSNHTLAVERSWLAQALAPGYRLGLGVNGQHAGVFWSGSVYSLESIDVWQAKGRAAGARAGYAPWREPGRVLHFGAALARERYDHPGADGAPALRVQPRVAGYFGDNSRLSLIDFRGGRDVSVDKFGVEAAGVHGAWSWQAEYGDARYDDGRQRGRVEAGYLQGSWLLTGEARPYDAKAGRFVPPKPQRRSGAWELVARYDHIRGRQWPLDRRELSADAWTVGVNWYAPRHFRVMLDWTDTRRRDEVGHRTLDRTGVLAGRVQFDF